MVVFNSHQSLVNGIPLHGGRATGPRSMVDDEMTISHWCASNSVIGSNQFLKNHLTTTVGYNQPLIQPSQLLKIKI